MGYVQKLLSHGEKIARVAHDHWIVLLPTILADGAVMVVIIALSALGVFFALPQTLFGLILLVVPLGHLVFRLLVWSAKQYVVTDRRIIEIVGMFNKVVADTSLEKINDIVMEQSAWGRLLKFGRIRIISGSDSGVDVFECIADPVGFKKVLLEQKTGLGRVSMAFEGKSEGEAPRASDVPALIAELDELRQKGLLTDAEFEEKRRKLLDRI